MHYYHSKKERILSDNDLLMLHYASVMNEYRHNSKDNGQFFYEMELMFCNSVNLCK